MKVGQLSEFVSLRVSTWRSIQRVLQSELFEEVYDSAEPELKQKIVLALTAGDLYTLNKLLKASDDIATYTVKQLRLMCRNRNIKNYHLMSKAELLSCLKR